MFGTSSTLEASLLTGMGMVSFSDSKRDQLPEKILTNWSIHYPALTRYFITFYSKRSPTNQNSSVDPNISGLSASNLLRPGTRDNLVCWAPTRKELWSIRISGACHLMVIQGFSNKLMLKQMSQVGGVLSCREISLKKGTANWFLQKFCPSWIWKVQYVFPWFQLIFD